jgi:hypothetical protein
MPPLIVMMDQKLAPQTLNGHESLDLRSIDAKAWKAILESCTAPELRLYYLKIKSLVGVERLRQTSQLSIEWANKVEDIAPLFAMRWLTKLFLSDFPRIRTIDGIEAMQDLSELHLSGNRGSLSPPLHLHSLLPIARLRNLERLEILNIRLEDRDISFVASAFPRLRNLRLSGKEFERAQFAFLAKELNAKLEEPLVSSWQMNYAPCPKCGRKLHVFMGRRMPILCEFCDERRFKKLTEEFENPAMRV